MLSTFQGLVRYADAPATCRVMIQAVYDTYDIIPVEQVVADEAGLPDIRLVFIGKSILIDSTLKILKILNELICAGRHLDRDVLERTLRRLAST